MQFRVILCSRNFSEFALTAYLYAVSLADLYRADWVRLLAIELRKNVYADDAPPTGDFASFLKDSLTAVCAAGLIILPVADGASDLARAEATIVARTEEFDKLISETNARISR